MRRPAVQHERVQQDAVSVHMCGTVGGTVCTVYTIYYGSTVGAIQYPVQDRTSTPYSKFVFQKIIYRSDI